MTKKKESKEKFDAKSELASVKESIERTQAGVGFVLVVLLIFGIFTMIALSDKADKIESSNVSELENQVAQLQQNDQMIIQWAEGFSQAMLLTLFQSGIIDTEGNVIDPVVEVPQELMIE